MVLDYLFGRTVYHGTGSISYLGPKIWDIVPIELKNVQSLNCFKIYKEMDTKQSSL